LEVSIDNLFCAFYTVCVIADFEAFPELRF